MVPTTYATEKTSCQNHITQNLTSHLRRRGIGNAQDIIVQDVSVNIFSFSYSRNSIVFGY